MTVNVNLAVNLTVNINIKLLTTPVDCLQLKVVAVTYRVIILGSNKMPKYGDEAFIYAMARMEEEQGSDEPEDVIINDINNGFVTIDDIEIPFRERAIIENKLYMTIPSDYVLMPQELANIKYPSENKPDIIFMNEDGLINISFKLIGIKLDNKDVETVTDLTRQGIVDGNPACKIISSAIIDEELQIGYFDFVSPVGDSMIYNLMFLFALEENIVLGSFNCVYYDRAMWLEIAVQTLRSIRAALHD